MHLLGDDMGILSRQRDQVPSGASARHCESRSGVSTMSGMCMARLISTTFSLALHGRTPAEKLAHLLPAAALP
jgi:hypothetical protein